MKTNFVNKICLFAAISMVMSVSAFGQTLDNFRATVPLTSLSSINMTSGASENGTLTGVACRVTTAVTGTPIAGFSISVNGGTAFAIGGGYYSSATTWGPTYFAASGNGGSSVGDYFFFPMSIPFTTSISVEYAVTHVATAGVLSCDAFVQY